MIHRFKELWDFDASKVTFLAAFSSGVSLANINVFLNTIVLLGSIIYIWRKVLFPKKKKNDEEETET